MSGKLHKPETDADAEVKTWRFEQFNRREYDMRLMLVGRTGSGKSSVGNSILGSKTFAVSRGFASTTKECSVEMVVKKGKKIRVLDTCGMFDAARPHDEVREEIRKSHLMIAPGPHAFLLVLPVEPFTQEHQETVRLLEAIFPDFYSHTILVFTKADVLDEDPCKRDSELQKALQGMKELKNLLEKVSGRYVLFDNREKDKNILEEQVFHLLDMVYDLYEARGQHHYDSEWFKQAEQAAMEGQRDIIKDVRSSTPDANRASRELANQLTGRVESNSFRREIQTAPTQNARRLAYVKAVEKGEARPPQNAMSFSSLANILPKQQSSTGTVYLSSRSGERVRDSTDLKSSADLENP